MAIQTVKTGAAVNDGTGDDARTAFTKINQNFTDNSHAANRLVGTEPGNVMEVGAFGLGKVIPNISNTMANNIDSAPTQIASWYETWAVLHVKNEDYNGLNKPNWAQLMFARNGGNPALMARYSYNGVITSWSMYHDKNTTKDSNGFLKAASPVVQLFADKIELNDEAKLQDITFEKLGVGDYLIKGSLGFAQEGWYIEMPKDANGNVLVAVVYEQLENNDISVKTYDYMLNKKGRIVPDLETPLDIPATRWIDLRLQALPQPDITPTDNTVTTNA
ncbi:hypothetical protein [Moraxella osloensis]|uniref:phage tail fiber protein n=1 Tax=Faucicola osloensis TaxID=34062 RepID=UPI0020069E50|nr:hypothetical protein [Moraxella osloensis]MCK6052518.1 hypothetical protein [Moraxella osloensis]